MAMCDGGPLLWATRRIPVQLAVLSFLEPQCHHLGRGDMVLEHPAGQSPGHTPVRSHPCGCWSHSSNDYQKRWPLSLGTREKEDHWEHGEGVGLP